VQQKVMVTVTEVDLPRKRIALSMKAAPIIGAAATGKTSPGPSRPQARVQQVKPQATDWFTEALNRSKKDLIPHQILHRPGGRQPARRPRVLLSDEVGLGKTIEACLILHRLLLSGRANRILILVPESLVHQWFVELLRRFNVWMHIFDAERCASIEAGEPGRQSVSG
jgi:hypothetical protein